MFKKIIIFLTLLAITYPSVSSLLHPGYFPIHDDIQTMRLHQMDKCIKDLQIPCRWVPDMGFGYGYPQFNYYAPLPYYFMEVFHLLGFSIIDSVKIGFAFGIIISAFGMYLLGKTLWKSRIAGLTSALFYVYFPYHAVNVYVRGAMGETWALSMMPFIFYSIYELIANQNKKAIVYLALSVFGLITSHNVSTLMFAPFCAVWLGYLLYLKKKNYVSDLKSITLSVLWGVGLSAFFLLPAWFEKEYVHVETIIQGYFNYLAHFVGLSQLLFSSYWGYGSSELGDYDGLSLAVGPIWWMLPISILIVFALLKRKEVKTQILLLVLAWLSLFMIHPKSVFIWQNLDLISFVQFPWRFLGIALFFFSLISGSFVLLTSKRKSFFVATVLVIIGFYSGFFTPSKHLNISDQDKFFGESWLKQQTISIFDYLPIFAELPPSAESPKTITSESEIIVNDDVSGSNWRKWDIEVKKDDTKLELPILYFPGWEMTDNGNKIEINPAEKTGVIELTLDSGDHNLNARLKDTPIRAISNIISLAAILMFVFRKRIFEKISWLN